jgi:hypothetical protein
MKSAPLLEQDKLGLGAAVVLEITLCLTKHIGPYSVYLDDFFYKFTPLK